MFLPNMESQELTPDVVDSVMELSRYRQYISDNLCLGSLFFNISKVFDSDNDR